jgi:hydroxypyruvate reductase
MAEHSAFLRQIFDAALYAVLPRACMGPIIATLPASELVIVGAGKAAAAMAQEIESRRQGPVRGIVIVPYGHAVECAHIEVLEAGHPVPDAAGVAATRRIVDLVQDLDASQLVCCLMSGGGSALMTLPADGRTLAEKQALTRELLKSGQPISEINRQRKALSAVKGGKLAELCAPAMVKTIIISDIPGNDASLVASGPSIRDGEANDVTVIATSDDALAAAASSAERAGYATVVLGDIEGDARKLAADHAALALNIAAGCGPVQAPAIIVSGGETTVSVGGSGRGGRNSEYALALARALRGNPAIAAIACDTDGIDGAGDNAGCMVLPDTLARASQLALDIDALQQNNDSYTFFEALGDLVMTGPTLTNVNDFRAILIEA